MGVGAGLYMYDVVVKKVTFAISSPDEFLSLFGSVRQIKLASRHILIYLIVLCRDTSRCACELCITCDLPFKGRTRERFDMCHKQHYVNVYFFFAEEIDIGILTIRLLLFYAVFYGTAEESSSRRIPDVRGTTRSVR